jgi:SSS family solute:Na+ symporter
LLAAGSLLAGESPQTLNAYRGTTPILDGLLRPGEWDDATTFSGVRDWTPQFSPVTSGADLALRGWVKHDGRRLYFAFEITDDVLYGIDTPRWLPDENPLAHELSPQGFPWFGDEMELLINASNEWKDTEGARGNGSSWQMVANLTKSRLGGVGVGGLLEGEPRRVQAAWDTYQKWILSRAQEAAVKQRPGGRGYVIEWAVSFHPCLEIEPGRFYDPSLGDRKMGLNIALGDLDQKEKGAGNTFHFYHEQWFAGRRNTRTEMREWGSLWIRVGRPGTLEVRVRSDDKPTAARVYITDAEGRPHLIPGAVTYSRRGEDHSVIDFTASAALPPGKYKVRAEKGPEYRAAETTVEVAASQTGRADLEVSRFYNMNEQGWYSADLHIHRNPEELPLLIRAEDLNLAPVITRHLGGARPPAPYPTSHVVRVDANHLGTLQNQEVERLGKGHGAVVLLNFPQPVEAELGVLHPPEAEFCRRARAAGAFIDGEKPIWKNIPVNVALGLIDAIGIVNNHFHPRAVMAEAEKWGSMERDQPVYQTPEGFAKWMMDLYYSFLDCGFRIPVSAGSASGVMPVWPGYERVYVQMSAPFTHQQWFEDLRAGRSVATNGPLLAVFLDGQPPGAQVDFQGPSSHSLVIDAQSQDRLDRIEIVFNGQVIRSFAGGGNAAFRTAVNLTIPEPGWLVVRVFEPHPQTVRYAHSSPFYFVRSGKLPVKRAVARRWADYVSKLAASVQQADYPSKEAWEQAQAVFREAENTYRRLAQ